MIAIKIENISQVQDDYYSGIKKLILDRLGFYELAFEVLLNSKTTNDLIKLMRHIELRTKTSLLKILLNDTVTFGGQNDYTKFTQVNIKSNYFSNAQNYRDTIVKLKDDVFLKKLIISLPQELITIETGIAPTFDTLENYKKVFKKIFDYDKFTDKDSSYYHAYDLATDLQVSVCPYCNRSYTSTIVTVDKNKIIRPSFDHFFAKSTHPILALSFYNLIPSCSNCNYYLKGEDEFSIDTHIHPYIESFGQDAKFDFWLKALDKEKSNPKNFDVILNVRKAALNIRKLEGSVPSDKEGNIKTFKLREIYKTHADTVGELFLKLDENSPYYANSIMNFIGQLNSNKREFYRFYFGNYYDEGDFNKRPLSKLTKDIVTKYLPEIDQ